MNFDRTNFQFHFGGLASASSQDCMTNSTSFSLLKSAINEVKRNNQPPMSSDSARRSWEGEQVRVQLKDLLPALLQAAVDERAWLDDFASEPVVISKDLHEVLSICQQIRQTQSRRAA